MNLVSVRIITADVDRMVDFYTRLTGAAVDRPVPDFAEIRTPNGTLALGSSRTVGMFGAGTAEPPPTVQRSSSSSSTTSTPRTPA